MATLVPQTGQQCRRIRTRSAQRGRKLCGLYLPIGHTPPAKRRVAALHDGAMAQAQTSRRYEGQCAAMCAGGLTAQRHVVRIAARGGDVVTDPEKRCALIEEPIVASHAS